MLLLNKFYTLMMNYFLPRDQFDPDKITCSVDEKPVNCETWEETK